MERYGHLRRIAGVAALAFSLAWFAGASSWLGWQEVVAIERLTVSYPGPSPFFILTEIARQRGFFREDNLDVKLLVTRSEVDRAALAAGEVDYTLRGDSPILSAARGLPVRLLMVGSTKPFWALVVRPQDNSVRDLKGRVFAIGGMGGAMHLTNKAILKQYGLDPDRDATYTVIMPGQRVPAMVAGAIGASLMDYAEAARAKKAGLKILLNSADYYSVLSSAVGAHLKKIREQPDQARRFIKGNVRGLKYIRENREGTLEVMVNWLRVDREMAEGIYQLSVNNYTQDGTVDERLLKEMIDRQLVALNIKEDIPIARVADFSLLKQVLSELR